MAKRLVSVGVLAILLGSSISMASAQTINAQLLYVNDFHGSISQSSKIQGRPVGGAAVLAEYLLEREKTNPFTLLIHGGDMVGASQPVSSLLQDEPTIELLNFMGFDVGIPGNHEFDESISEMLRIQNGGSHPVTGFFPGSGFPMVCCNIVNTISGEPILPPYIIKPIDGVPVAFIGVTTQETPSIVMPSGVQGVSFMDPIQAVNMWIPSIQAKGVKAIILIAHEGGNTDASGKVTGPITAIAEGVDNEVDLILSAHSHTMLNNVVGGKLVVQAYSKGTAFADIDLKIDKDTGDITSAQAEIITTFADTIKQEPTIARLVKEYENNVKPLVDRVIATTDEEITRALSPAGESALGNLIADSQREAAKTQIAFMNPGGIRRDLPKGTLNWGVLYETQPFANDLMKFTMTGDQIYAVLNQQWQPSGANMTVRFLQTSGIKWVWDDRRPVGDKVVSISLNDNSPIERNKLYSVVANVFIATGGDNFTVFNKSTKQEYVMNDLDALVNYLQSLDGKIKAGIEGRAALIK